MAPGPFWIGRLLQRRAAPDRVAGHFVITASPSPPLPLARPFHAVIVSFLLGYGSEGMTAS